MPKLIDQADCLGLQLQLQTLFLVIQALKTLTELHVALSHAGQPHYLRQTYMYSMQNDLDSRISVMQAELQQWKAFLAQLHTCNPALLFLSVRQLHTCTQYLAAAQTAGTVSHDSYGCLAVQLLCSDCNLILVFVATCSSVIATQSKGQQPAISAQIYDAHFGSA